MSHYVKFVWKFLWGSSVWRFCNLIKAFLCLPWRFNYPDYFLATICIVFLVYDKLEMNFNLQLCNLWRILLAKSLGSKFDRRWWVRDNPLNLTNKGYLRKTLHIVICWDIWITTAVHFICGYNQVFMYGLNCTRWKSIKFLLGCEHCRNIFYKRQTWFFWTLSMGYFKYFQSTVFNLVLSLRSHLIFHLYFSQQEMFWMWLIQKPLTYEWTDDWALNSY